MVVLIGGDVSAADIQAWVGRAMSDTRTVVAEDDPPVWVARAALADGCMGFGASESEALADLRSALPEWAALGLKYGDPVPGLTTEGTAAS